MSRPRFVSSCSAGIAAIAAILALALAAGCGHSAAAQPPPVTATADAERAAALEALEARVSALESAAERSVMLEDSMQELARRLQALEQKGSAGSARAPAATRPPGPNPALVYSIPIAGNPAIGRADAKVTLVEGYEYACFYCDKARATLAELKQKYGRELRVVHKHFVVHPQPATAPALAACAADKQGHFEEMDQQIWEKMYAEKNYDKADCWDEPEGCPIVLGLAKELRLNLARFKADMRGTCKTQIAADQALLKTLGMAGTPGFFINGRWISGAQPLEVFTALIDEELGKATQRIAAGTPRARYYQTHVVDQGIKVGAPPATALAELAGYLADVPGNGKLQAAIRTSMGTFRCELFPDEAPLTVTNFVGLATGKKEWSRDGKPQRGKPFYDGLTFHRVIPGFMIQGGDPDGVGSGGPGYTFKNEISPNLLHVAGALSMANAGSDTNGSQFFITETARHELDGAYSVFGRCADLALVKNIAGVARDNRDAPLTAVTIDGISFSRQ